MRSCDLPLPKSLPQGEGLFFDYPLRVGNPVDSPSLAEGVRGWVNRIFVFASECVARTRQSTFSRHCEAVAIATTKQSKIKIWIVALVLRSLAMTNGVDCHDFASQNLAMTNLSQIYESLRDSRNDKSARFVIAMRFIAEANQTINQIRSKK